MEIEELEIVRLELKYCERCGGLWLRLQGGEDVYCAGCAEQVANLPVRRSKSTHRLPIHSRFTLKSAADNRQAWPLTPTEGGNA